MATPLLTNSDIRKYRQLALNFSADKMNAYIADLSENFLKPQLGKVLHLEFIKGLAAVTVDQKWIDLLDGVEYTDSSGDLIKFEGVKPFLVFHFLSIFTREGDSHLTEVGTVNINSDTYGISKDKREMEASYKNRTVSYANEINDFLAAKSDIYTSSKPKINGNMTDLTFSII